VRKYFYKTLVDIQDFKVLLEIHRQGENTVRSGNKRSVGDNSPLSIFPNSDAKIEYKMD
jgi:hypothetical protein